MSARTTEPVPITTTGRLWAVTGIAASSGFVGLLLLLHVLQPELDPTWRFVSEYALGTAGFLMTAAFLCLAVASVSVVALFWGQARTVTGRVGVVLTGISGLGMLIAAVFPTDPITTAPEDATATGTLHLVGGQLNLTPFAILLITLGLRRASAWRSVRAAQWTTVVAALVASVGFVVSSAIAGGIFEPGVYAGLFGRMMLIAYAGWVVVSGSHAYRLSRATGAHESLPSADKSMTR